jgi:hypothetical protein
MNRVLPLMLAVSLSTGCTPATRQDVGAGILVIGAVMAVVATRKLAPCLGDNTAVPPDPCATDACTAASNSTNGIPLLVGGLSLIFLGSVALVTSTAGRASPPNPVVSGSTPLRESRPPDPAWVFLAHDDEPQPFALDLETACALTERYLEQPVFSTGGALIGFRVMSCRGPLQVSKDHAILENVYLRGAASTEEKVNVHFEHRAAWLVASVGVGSAESPSAR